MAMQTPHEPKKLPERLIWSVLGGLVFFQVVTSVSYLLRNGRLAIGVPLFDDVGYLRDGLARLQTFDRGGIIGLLGSFFHDPPHAPFLSILSTLGFAVTPGEMTGAYALSSVWVLAGLALAACLLRGLPSATRAGILCAVLALPIFNTVIGVFRPDIAWGLLTGATATILATTDLLRTSRPTLFLIGALVGLSMLSKPTGMPAGVAVMGTGYVAAAAIAYFEDRSGSVRTLLKGSLLLGLGAAIVSLPYYIVAAPHVLAYIWNVMVDQRELWQEPGSLKTHLLYLFQPSLALSMLGWLWPAGAGAMIAYGAVCALRSSSEFQALLRFIATLLVLCVAYAIPALSPVKNAYIGCLFYGTAAMVFIWNIGNLLCQLPVPPYIVAVAGLIAFIVFWRPANVHTRLNPPMLAADAAHRAIMPSVLPLLSQKDSAAPIPQIFVASIGPIFDATISYFARKQGLRANILSGYATANWNELLRVTSKADIVVVSDTGSLGQSSAPFPVTRLQDQLLQTLKNDSHFRVLTSYVDTTGHHTVVFARHFMASQVLVTYPSGFADQEGPYPELGLSTFRWMLKDEATIRLISNEAARVAIELRCLAVVTTEIVSRLPIGNETTTSVELPGGTAASNMRKLTFHATLGAKEPLILDLLAKPRGPVPPGWPAPLLCETPPTLSAREP